MGKTGTRCCHEKHGSPDKFMEISLLCLLEDETSHGYSLAEKLQDYGFAKEDLNISTLYRILRKTEKSGFIASSWEKSGQGPDRRVYTLTDTGKSELEQWINTLKTRKSAIEKLIAKYEDGRCTT